MIFVDTGYFIALISAEDELHPQAVSWSDFLLRSSSETLVTTEYVMWEFLNFFGKTSLRADALLLWDHFSTHRDCVIIPPSSDLFLAGLDLYRQCQDKYWSLTDCISFVVMKKQNILKALSFDKHFIQAGFQALLRTQPQK